MEDKDTRRLSQEILAGDSEVRASDAFYRLLVEHSPDTVLIHNASDGRILFYNHLKADFLGGGSVQEIIGKNAIEFVHPESREMVMKIIGEACDDFLKGLPAKRVIEHRFVRLDGTEFFGEATGIPFLYMGRLAIHVIVRDITQRKKDEEFIANEKDRLESLVLERTQELVKTNEQLKKEIAERKLAEEMKEKMQAQLLHAQKMELVGKLTSGIAHDFNNIIAIIQTLNNLALGEASGISEAGGIKEYLERINSAAERASRLTRQLMIFSRSHPASFSSVNINKLVDNVVGILRFVIGEKIAIRTVLAPALWHIWADPRSIEHVLTNLIVNAKEAIQGGGMIYIKTRNVMCGGEGGEDVPVGRRGAYVCLSVEDSGGGMSRETKNRLFEPFFTTKQDGKSVGLGLTVVKNIIKDHDGLITLESEPESGSVFNIYLPVEEREKDKAPGGTSHEESGKSPCGKGEKLLLVEDEKMLRYSLKIALSKNGYTVFEAANAEEAMSVFENERHDIDLVFTDVVLTGKNGIDLVKDLLVKKPGLAVLFSSGYLDTESQWEFIHKKNFRFIQKPYDPNALFSTLAEIFEKKWP